MQSPEFDYPFSVRRLSAEEGGGYFIEFPDLPGCVADGETVEQALDQCRGAIQAWVQMAQDFGDPVPPPGMRRRFSGKWLQRVPVSLHAALAMRAEAEGVSLNTLVTALLAEGLGMRRKIGHR